MTRLMTVKKVIVTDSYVYTGIRWRTRETLILQSGVVMTIYYRIHTIFVV